MLWGPGVMGSVHTIQEDFRFKACFTWILKVVGQFPGVERESPPGRDSTSAKVRKSRTRLRNRNSLLVWVEFRIFNGV